MKPIVAIVGRPNVGKSTLFNKIVGGRPAIVEDTPGVTRDRLFRDAEWNGVPFTLVDTGGIEPRSDDIILSQMRAQAMIAIETADVVVLVTDITTGMTAADSEVADMLLKAKRMSFCALTRLTVPVLLRLNFMNFTISVSAIRFLFQPFTVSERVTFLMRSSADLKIIPLNLRMKTLCA